jgi:hypothetical protein
VKLIKIPAQISRKSKAKRFYFFLNFASNILLESSPEDLSPSRSRHKVLEIKHTENFYVFENFASNTVLE